MTKITKELFETRVELTVELDKKEFEPYIIKGANVVSKDIRIKGFRKGKIPYEILKQKVDESLILKEAAKIAISENVYNIIDKELKEEKIRGSYEIHIEGIEENFIYKIIVPIYSKSFVKEYNKRIKELLK